MSEYLGVREMIKAQRHVFKGGQTKVKGGQILYESSPLEHIVSRASNKRKGFDNDEPRFQHRSRLGIKRNSPVMREGAAIVRNRKKKLKEQVHWVWGICKPNNVMRSRPENH